MVPSYLLYALTAFGDRSTEVAAFVGFKAFSKAWMARPFSIATSYAVVYCPDLSGLFNT